MAIFLNDVSTTGLNRLRSTGRVASIRDRKSRRTMKYQLKAQSYYFSQSNKQSQHFWLWLCELVLIWNWKKCRDTTLTNKKWVSESSKNVSCLRDWDWRTEWSTSHNYCSLYGYRIAHRENKISGVCVCTTYTTVQRVDVQMVHIFIVDICDLCVYINTDVKPPSSLRRSNEVGEAENEERASLKVVEREMQRETHTHTCISTDAAPYHLCGWLLPLGNTRLAQTDSQ
jgi:hypothetical protein